MPEHNLENLPTNPTLAINYRELLDLWKKQQQISEKGIREPSAEFWAWEEQVKALLTGRERSFFLEPHLKDLDPKDPDIARVNRFNHLTKILWYRQGLITSNGFNG